MKLIVDINDSDYKDIQKYGTVLDEDRDDIADAIKNGIPLDALGEEMRTVRGGITDEKVLIGFNMAVAICNKHISGKDGE